MEVFYNQEIREMEQRLALKEQEIFLLMEQKMSEWKEIKKKLTDMYEGVK